MLLGAFFGSRYFRLVLVKFRRHFGRHFWLSVYRASVSAYISINYFTMMFPHRGGVSSRNQILRVSDATNLPEDFRLNPFVGDMINPRTGKSDVGPRFCDLIESLRVESARLGCGEVVATDLQKSITEEDLQLHVDLLERLPATSKEAGRIRRVIQTAKDEQTKLDEQARKVLALLLKELIHPDIAATFVAMEKSQGTHAEEALHLIMDEMYDKYHGQPYQRREELLVRRNNIGGATTVADMSKVIAQFVKQDVLTEGWLSYVDGEDADGVDIRVPHDANQQPISDAEKNRDLAKRLSGTVLAPYRAMALQAVGDGTTFKDLVYQIMAMKQNEVDMLEVVDDKQQQAPARHAMLASVEEPSDAAVSIYQAYYAQGYEAHAQKRRRMDNPQHHAGGVPGRLDCFYWDGRQCDFEEHEDRPCGFAMSHVLGKPTPGFKKYQPKPQRPGVGAMQGVQGFVLSGADAAAVPGTHM